jgi:hypothetical protein
MPEAKSIALLIALGAAMDLSPMAALAGIE